MQYYSVFTLISATFITLTTDVYTYDVHSRQNCQYTKATFSCTWSYRWSSVCREIQPFEILQLHLKYPLYKSNPVTVWSEKLKSAHREVTPLEGTTKIADPLNPFKRNGNFSTPVSQRLDEPEI